FGSFIKKSTSGFGLFQFSVENAYNVNTLTLYLTAARTILCTTVMPSLCPAIRGRPFLLAHRPLLSMIIATCSGGFPNIPGWTDFCYLSKKGNHTAIIHHPKAYTYSAFFKSSLFILFISLCFHTKYLLSLIYSIRKIIFAIEPTKL